VKLVNDRETGRPRGFGFVEMSSADAARAIQSVNGQDMGGRPLRVNEAREREARPPRQNNARWSFFSIRGIVPGPGSVRIAMRGSRHRDLSCALSTGSRTAVFPLSSAR
jgi:RNA recognition motif-containing protein